MNTDRSVDSDFPVSSTSSIQDELLNLCYLAGNKHLSIKSNPYSEKEKLKIDKEGFEKKLIDLFGKYKANELLKKITCYICYDYASKETVIGPGNQFIGANCFDKIMKNYNRYERKCPNCRGDWKNISCLSKKSTFEKIKEILKSLPDQDECEDFCKDGQGPFGNHSVDSNVHNSGMANLLEDQFGLGPAVIFDQLSMPLNELSQKLTMEKNCYLRLLKQKEDVWK